MEIARLENRKFYLQPFKAGNEKKGFDIDDKWKIIKNVKIDIEE
jgi:hypothetical protein